MTKAELVEALAIKCGVTKKHTAEFLETIFEEIAAAVKKEGRFSYPGFGTWTMRKRKARTIRNPQTQELMQLPVSFTMGFRQAKIHNGTVTVEPRKVAKVEAAETAVRARHDALEEADREDRGYVRDEILGI